jgi:hypothetical protein
MAGFKLRLDGLNEDIARIAEEIRDRAERREVEVVREKDFSRGVEQVVRADTGEVISTRVLSPHERQTEMRGIMPPIEHDTKRYHRVATDELCGAEQGDDASDVQ